MNSISPGFFMIEPNRECMPQARKDAAGWRLNEAHLACSYGVSRTVTRDVVGRLQPRGLPRKDDSAR